MLRLWLAYHIYGKFVRSYTTGDYGKCFSAVESLKNSNQSSPAAMVWRPEDVTSYVG